MSVYEEVTVIIVLLHNFYLLKRFYQMNTYETKEAVGKMTMVKKEFVNLLNILVIFKLFLLGMIWKPEKYVIFICVAETLSLVVLILCFSNLLKAIDVLSTFEDHPIRSPPHSQGWLLTVYAVARLGILFFQTVDTVSFFLLINSIFILRVCLLSNEIWISYIAVYRHVRSLFEGHLKHESVKKKVHSLVQHHHHFVYQFSDVQILAGDHSNLFPGRSICSVRNSASVI